MTEDLQKFKILASETRVRAAYRWLSDWDRAMWSEVRDFVTSFVLPGDEFRILLNTAKMEERAGRQPRDVADLADSLRLELARKWCSLDALSIVGASVPPGDEGDSFPWTMLAPSYFLAPFQPDGGYLTITGVPRTGKTGIACLYGEMWSDANPGCELLTNIPLDGKIPFKAGVPNPIRSVSAMSNLMEGVADALEAERRWLWELDEGGLVWLKAQANRTSSVGLEKFARIVPKLGGSLLYIEQRIEGVPSTLQDFAQSHVYCERPGFAQMDLPARRTSLRAIPKPKRFRYKTGETGFFEVDVDVEKMIARLRLDEDTKHKTQAERIRGYLGQHRSGVARAAQIAQDAAAAT